MICEDGAKSTTFLSQQWQKKWVLRFRALSMVLTIKVWHCALSRSCASRLGVPGLHPLGKNTMRNRFNEYRDALGISKKKKFYSWKHTGAISRYDNGMPIYELKDHLRHSSIATTEEYLKKHVPKTDNADKYIDVL